MDGRRNERLADAELHALVDRWFPKRFTRAEVVFDIALEVWEQPTLLARFRPSVEQRYEEVVRLHRNIEAMRNAPHRAGGEARENKGVSSEPTLEEVHRECQPTPVRSHEEVTDLIGLCLWDVFCDNHDVITADGRVADIGPFRGAAGFSTST